MKFNPAAGKKSPRFVRKQKGAAAIEYAIIAGLIAVAFMATAQFVGVEINTVFDTILTELEEVNEDG